jgi:hypothetical protein
LFFLTLLKVSIFIGIYFKPIASIKKAHGNYKTRTSFHIHPIYIKMAGIGSCPPFTGPDLLQQLGNGPRLWLFGSGLATGTGNMVAVDLVGRTTGNNPF